MSIANQIKELGVDKHLGLKEHTRIIEDARREKSSISFRPQAVPEGWPDQIFDYSSPGLKAEVGLMGLRESLPNGQKLRTEVSFRALKEGVLELEVWLKANGFEI